MNSVSQRALGRATTYRQPISHELSNILPNSAENIYGHVVKTSTSFDTSKQACNSQKENVQQCRKGFPTGSATVRAEASRRGPTTLVNFTMIQSKIDPMPSNPVRKKAKKLWEEILDSPAKLIAQTADFDGQFQNMFPAIEKKYFNRVTSAETALLRLPFSGTILDPVTAADALTQDASYSVWASVQRVLDTMP